MTASAFIDSLESRGVSFYLVAGEVRVKAPPAVLSERARQALTALRGAIAHEMLKRQAQAQFNPPTPQPSIPQKVTRCDRALAMFAPLNQRQEMIGEILKT